jgi:transcriptional regulator with XRE-family HTH domain
VIAMLLGELAQQHGIASAAELGRRLGVARQHAWMLWTGRYLPNHETLQALISMGLPLKALAQLDRAAPSKKPQRGPARRREKGQKPRGKSPEEEGR